MTYAYGLGDFFSVMFEDTSIPNLLLESDTLVASEVYSKFLQLTSGMSLEDVQTSIGSQIQLVLLSSNDLVEGTLSTYKLPIRITSSRYIANRPMLPTELLESKVDFDLIQEIDGTCYVKLARVLDNSLMSSGGEYAFSSRRLQDGSTQYALWFVDSHIDERLISSCFGNLISIAERNSSEDFANFIYGLYYMYTQGPTLTVLRRGLNLVIGIPLARLEETVIDIRMYLQTDQYIVITDQNQYVIPYGLPPSVRVGDLLQVGQELAQWVEVKDYTHDGDWWLNLYIPSTLVPEPPSGEFSRYAIAGGHMDYIMREYLKTHTFLVRVNVTTFKNNQTFAELFSIIRRSKPAYTQPVYVWAVLNDENIVIAEDPSSIDIKHRLDEDLGASYDHMNRSAAQPLSRGTARFIRFNASSKVGSLVGEYSALNSSNNNVQLLPVSGYSNTQAVLGGNSWDELDWISVLSNRASDTWRGRRDQVGYRRGDLVTPLTPDRPGESWDGSTLLHQSTQLSKLFTELPEDCRVVPLTILSKAELDAKLEVFGESRPTGTNRFTLRAYDRTRSINAHEIHYPVLERAASSLWPTQATPTPLEMVKFFGVRSYSLASEDPVTEVLGVAPASMNKDMCKSMFYQGGLDVEYASEGDLLLFCEINCSLTAVYLITQDAQSSMPSFLPVESPIEEVQASATGLAVRGMAHHQSPVYFRRGSLSFDIPQGTESLEDPSTQLANFLYSKGIPESSKIVPLTVLRGEEAEEKARFWGTQLESTSKYSLLDHPYNYRLEAERVLKKSNAFIAISPSLNSMFQDKDGAIPVTGMEQPVGLMVDKYGMGASAYQENSDFRPVVRARYNLLRFTNFEGTIESSSASDVGGAPSDWSIISSTSGAYIRRISNGVLRLEADNASILLGQDVQLPANSSTKFHLGIALNPSELSLRELVEVQVLSGTAAVKYAVSGVEVDPAVYSPGRETSVIATLDNSTTEVVSLRLVFGLGLHSSKTGLGVTGTAAFKSPDYRYDLGQTGLPYYQRVGSPVAGTSTQAGVPDYETEGFPPYLSFDGVDDFLSVSATKQIDSERVTVFASVMKPSRTSSGTPVELWSSASSGVAALLLQENNSKILTEDLLSALAVEGVVRLSLSWPYATLPSVPSLEALIEGLYGQTLSYTIDNTSTPVFGTYSAVVDTAGTVPSREMQVYYNGEMTSYTVVEPGPLDTFSFSDAQLTIGSSGGSTSFFEGNIFGIIVAGNARSVDERDTVEAWIKNELTSYAYKANSSLYYYPDFFRRDGLLPEIQEAPRGNIYEFTPDYSYVDMDWGYDRLLAYRLDRDTVGLYWISNRDEGVPGDYWTISYSGIPTLTRVSSGVPEQNGLVVVDPFREPPSLNYEYPSRAVDYESVNALIASPDSVFLYSDHLNTNIVVTRGGMTLKQSLLLQ